MTEFKEQWNLEMALAVLGSEKVETGLWSEAVRWLLLFGPPQLKELLDGAANNAFAQCFPGVRPQGYDQNGQPYYDLHDLATAQGIPAADVAEQLTRLQDEVGLELLVEGDRVYKVN